MTKTNLTYNATVEEIYSLTQCKSTTQTNVKKWRILGISEWGIEKIEQFYICVCLYNYMSSDLTNIDFI